MVMGLAPALDFFERFDGTAGAEDGMVMLLRPSKSYRRRRE